MFYGVKLNGEELFMAKKSLMLLHFIWSKNLTKLLDGNLFVKEGRGREDVLAGKLNSAKKFKSQLLMVPKLSSLLHDDNKLDMMLRENR